MQYSSSFPRNVTDNNITIEKMREEQAEEAAREFCNKLMELGYDLEEAEKFFREKVAEAYSSQVTNVG